MSISEDRAELIGAAADRAQLDALHDHQESLKALAARTREAEQARRPTASNLMRTNVASHGTIEIAGGSASLNTGRAMTATAVSSPRPGMVTVGGMTTTIEAAKAAGLVAQDYDPSFRAGVAAAPQPNQQAPQPNPQVQQQQQPQSKDENTIKATTEQAKAINASTAAIEQANEAIGNFAVSSLLEDAVVSGDIPTTPPKGISAEQVSAIVAGYTAQANAVLADTGATAELLSDMLNANELRAARLAVHRGNDGELKELGRRAFSRLLSLPNDPANLKAMTSGADWADVEITRSKAGDTMVKAPGWPKAVLWSDAIRRGLIWA